MRTLLCEFREWTNRILGPQNSNFRLVMIWRRNSHTQSSIRSTLSVLIKTETGLVAPKSKHLEQKEFFFLVRFIDYYNSSCAIDNKTKPQLRRRTEASIAYTRLAAGQADHFRPQLRHGRANSRTIEPPSLRGLIWPREAREWPRASQLWALIWRARLWRATSARATLIGAQRVLPVAARRY